MRSAGDGGSAAPEGRARPRAATAVAATDGEIAALSRGAIIKRTYLDKKK